MLFRHARTKKGARVSSGPFAFFVSPNAQSAFILAYFCRMFAVPLPTSLTALWTLQVVLPRNQLVVGDPASSHL